MKTTFSILFAIACIVYAGNPTINFKPFSISFEKPYLPFAVLFLVMSVYLFQLQSEINGYKRGVNKCIETIKNFKSDK